MICNTGLKALCVEASDPQSMISELTCLFDKEFTEKEIEKRKHFFDAHFNNQESAKQVIAILEKAQG